MNKISLVKVHKKTATTIINNKRIIVVMPYEVYTSYGNTSQAIRKSQATKKINLNLQALVIQ